MRAAAGPAPSLTMLLMAAASPVAKVVSHLRHPRNRLHPNLRPLRLCLLLTHQQTCASAFGRSAMAIWLWFIPGYGLRRWR